MPSPSRHVQVIARRASERVALLVSPRRQGDDVPPLEVLHTVETSVIRPIIVLIMTVVVGMAAFVWLNRPIEVGPDVAIQGGMSISDGTSTSTADANSAVMSATSADTKVTVDVEGAVRYPGLRTLPSGSRVADAIKVAGGLRHQLPIGSINLAARLTDGQLLIVASTSPSDAMPTHSTGQLGAAPINLNTATKEQLDELPGVGPVMSQRIVEYRDQHNGFRSVDDLQNVSGIGPKLFADVSPLVTV